MYTPCIYQSVDDAMHRLMTNRVIELTAKSGEDDWLRAGLLWIPYELQRNRAKGFVYVRPFAYLPLQVELEPILGVASLSLAPIVVDAPATLAYRVICKGEPRHVKVSLIDGFRLVSPGLL